MMEILHLVVLFQHFKPEKISIESAFSVGWAHTKRQFVPLLLVMAVVALLRKMLGSQEMDLLE